MNNAWKIVTVKFLWKIVTVNYGRPIGYSYNSRPQISPKIKTWYES